MKKFTNLLLISLIILLISITSYTSYAYFLFSDTSDNYIHIGTFKKKNIIKPIKLYTYELSSKHNLGYNKWLHKYSHELLDNTINDAKMPKDFIEIKENGNARNTNLILNLNSPLITTGERLPLEYKNLTLDIYLNNKHFYKYDLHANSNKICAYGVLEGTINYLNYKAYSDSLFIDLSEIIGTARGIFKIQFTNEGQIHSFVFNK